MRKLQDENDNLSRHTSASSCRKELSIVDDDNDESESSKDQHMQLILYLSEKVSWLYGYLIYCNILAKEAHK